MVGRAVREPAGRPMYCTGPGGVVSRTKLTVSGALMFPATSTALTENVHVPSSSVLTSAESLAASSASTLPALRDHGLFPDTQAPRVPVLTDPRGVRDPVPLHCGAPRAREAARRRLRSGEGRRLDLGVGALLHERAGPVCLPLPEQVQRIAEHRRVGELGAALVVQPLSLPTPPALCKHDVGGPARALGIQGEDPALEWHGFRPKTPEEPVLTCSMGPAGSPDGSTRQ